MAENDNNLVRGDENPDTEPTPDTESDRVDITIMVEGGLIQEINIPEHLSNIVIVVKDYDVDGTDEEKMKEDKYGCYIESEYRNK